MIAKTVDALMTRSPVTIPLTSGLDEAAKVMREQKLRHLLVVDEQGMLAGVLSDRDVRAASASDRTWKDSRKQELFLHSYKVEDVANLKPLRVHVGAPIRDAVSLMRQTKIGCLPVMDGGRPVGIITGRDLLDLLLAYIDEDRDQPQEPPSGLRKRPPSITGR